MRFIPLKKSVAVLLISTLIGAQFSFMCEASEFTKAELGEKYSAKTEYWKLAFGDGIINSDIDKEDYQQYMTEIDDDGVGNDGICYGEQYAGKTIIVINPNLIQECGTQLYYPHGEFEYADGMYYVKKQDGTAMILRPNHDYLNEKGIEKLTIPEKLDGLTVTEIGECAFQVLRGYVPSIREISVPDTVVKVRGYAFYDAFGMETGCKINIPNHIEYMGKLSYGGLGYALGENVTLPETLEYYCYCALTDTIIQELTLPESAVFVEFGRANYLKPDADQGTVRASVWFPNYISVDDKYYNANNLEKVRQTRSFEAMLEMEQSGEQYLDNDDYIPVPFADIPEIETSIKKVSMAAETSKRTGSGDINVDGEIDVQDAVLLARFLVEDADARVSEIGKKNADIDGDGKRTTNDVTVLLRKIAKLE